MLDVITTIQENMLNDDDNQSDRLVQTYEDADAAKRAIIDDVLIMVCGYSMPSLIGMAVEVV